MRDRAFPNLLAVRITEIFLLMLLVNNIICVTVHFLLSPRTYHSNISLNGVCELAFLCLTGNYIIYKLDNKTCNPVNMKKKKGFVAKAMMSTSPFFNAKLLSACG
jgi:hypothetical protein